MSDCVQNGVQPAAGGNKHASPSGVDINSADFRNALIEQVRDRPEIWNPRATGLGQQRDREAAKSAWEQVTERMRRAIPAVTGDDCKRCWKQLRDSYTRCVRDEVKHGKRRRRTTWPFYDSLNFLRTVIGGAWANCAPADDAASPTQQQHQATTSAGADGQPVQLCDDNEPAAKCAKLSADLNTPVQVELNGQLPAANVSDALPVNGVCGTPGNYDLTTLLALASGAPPLPQHVVAQTTANTHATLMPLSADAAVSAGLVQQQNGGLSAGEQTSEPAAWKQIAAALIPVQQAGLNTNILPAGADLNANAATPQYTTVSADDEAFGRTVAGCLSRLSVVNRELVKVRINRVLTEAALADSGVDASQLLVPVSTVPNGGGMPVASSAPLVCAPTPAAAPVTVPQQLVQPVVAASQHQPTTTVGDQQQTAYLLAAAASMQSSSPPTQLQLRQLDAAAAFLYNSQQYPNALTHGIKLDGMPGF